MQLFQYKNLLRDSDEGAGGGGDSSESQETESQPQETPSYSEDWQNISSVALTSVPDEEKAILDKHMPRVAAGFENTIGRYKSQLETYSGLGEPEYVKNAVNLARVIDNNPDSLYRVLHERGIKPPAGLFDSQSSTSTTTQSQGTVEVDDDIAQSPAFKALTEQLEKVQGALNSMTQERERETQTRAQQEAQQRADEHIRTLAENYEIPDNIRPMFSSYLKGQLATVENLDVVKAIKDFQDSIRSLGAPTSKPSVPNLGNGNGLPSIPQDVTPGDLDGDKRRQLVTNMINDLKDQ